MHIIIRIRSVYGIETFYPSCPSAHLLAKIARTKTLTRQALRDIAALGYEIRIDETNNQRIIRQLQEAVA